METPAPYTPPTRPRSIWRRIAMGSAIFVGLLLLALVLLAAVFDDQVSQRLIREVNKSLKNDMQVGKVSLSLLSGFPEASINLSNVKVRDASGDALLLAKEMSFRFQLFSLFGDRIDVHAVSLTDGVLRVRINPRGQANYDIVKETPASKTGASDSELQINLENAELHNIRVIYTNDQTRQEAEIMLENAGFNGNFSASQYNLASQADLRVYRIDLDSSRYLAGEKIHYDAVIGINTDKGLYDLQRFDLTIGGNTFAVDGIAVEKTDFTELNLKLLSQEGDISMLANLLPGEYHQYFSDFQSTGNYSCSGLVVGRLGKNNQPRVAFDISLRDGKVSSDKLQSPLRNVSFTARYTAQPDGSGDFEIRDFQGDFGGQAFGFNLKISNMESPDVDFRCSGALPLSAAYGLFDDPAITGGDGAVLLKSLSVQGKYADMTSMSRIGRVSTSGEVVFDNAEISYNKVPVSVKTGALRLQDNVFSVDTLRIQAGRSDFAIDGNARNLLPVLFSDSLNTSDAFIDFGLKMKTRQLDVDQLLGMFVVQETAAEVGQETLDSLRTDKNETRRQNTDRLRGVFEATIQQFQYGKIVGRNFEGKLGFDHNELLISGDAEAMDGALHLEGEAHFELQPRLNMRVTAKAINLRACMEQCENFGQDFIVADNLRGMLSGRVVIQAYWNPKGEFDMNRLRVLADVTGTDGELVGLQMLEDFSSFIHIEDLRRIKFSRMQNYLEITNRRIILPAMLIQSNAVNLTLSGTQTFDDEINYKVRVNAGQVLLNRIKRHDADLDPLPAEKGWFNLYYSIVGTLDKYEMKRNKKGVKAEFERSEDRKKQIAAAIDAAFNTTPTFPVATSGAPATAEEFLDEIQGGGGN